VEKPDLSFYGSSKPVTG